MPTWFVSVRESDEQFSRRHGARRIKFSPDGRFVVTGGVNTAWNNSDQRPEMRWLDRSTGKIHLELSGDGTFYFDFAWLPDGTLAAGVAERVDLGDGTGRYDHFVDLWDSAGKKLRRVNCAQDG